MNDDFFKLKLMIKSRTDIEMNNVRKVSPWRDLCFGTSVNFWVVLAVLLWLPIIPLTASAQEKKPNI